MLGPIRTVVHLEARVAVQAAEAVLVKRLHSRTDARKKRKKKGEKLKISSTRQASNNHLVAGANVLHGVHNLAANMALAARVLLGGGGERP